MLKSEVDLNATAQVYQVGAHFKALGKGESMEPSVLRCIFFLRTKPALVSYVIMPNAIQLRNVTRL